MGTSEWIATLALIVSSGALFLELRRWYESGAKIHITIMADAMQFPVDAPDDDDRPKLLVRATNRGDVPTTLTLMVVYSYRNWLYRRLGKPFRTAFVPQTIGYWGSPGLPAQVGVNETWHGVATYTETLTEHRRKGRLYAGVIASHSNRPFLVKVPPESPVLPEEKLGSE